MTNVYRAILLAGVGFGLMACTSNSMMAPPIADNANNPHIGFYRPTTPQPAYTSSTTGLIVPAIPDSQGAMSIGFYRTTGGIPGAVRESQSMQDGFWPPNMNGGNYTPDPSATLK